jgi:methionyl aminopeptidase
MSTIPNLDAEISKEEKTYYYNMAGKIAYETLEELKQLVKPGAKVIEICDKAQALILEKGGKPSFPCSVSINNIASYYTSPDNDETVIPEGSVVKVDLGAHVNGFISNKAESFCFNEDYKTLVEASQQAWKNAMELVRVGTETNMLGVAVEDTVREFNYLPIRELSGNLIDRYQLFGNKMLPNVRLPFGKADSVMEVDEAYTFETFATTGSGSVHTDQSKTYIYMLKPSRVMLRSQGSRDVQSHIFREYFTLPFAEHWITSNPNFHPARVRLTLRELKKANGVVEFSVLSDIKESFISQYQNTFIVTDSGYKITSMPPFDFEKPESIKEKEEQIEEALKSVKETIESEKQTDSEPTKTKTTKKTTKKKAASED